MSDRKKANRIKHADQYRLWDWLRVNKEVIERDKWTLSKITKAATDALEIVATRNNIGNACKVVGVEWTRDPRGTGSGGKLSDHLKARIKALEDSWEQVQRGPTGLVDVYKQLHTLHQKAEVLGRDLHTAQKAIAQQQALLKQHADALTDAWKRDQDQKIETDVRVHRLEQLVLQLCSELGVKAEVPKESGAAKQHTNGQFHTTRIVG